MHHRKARQTGYYSIPSQCSTAAPSITLTPHDVSEIDKEVRDTLSEIADGGN